MESVVQGELQAAVWRGGREALVAVYTVDESKEISILEGNTQQIIEKTDHLACMRSNKFSLQSLTSKLT